MKLFGYIEGYYGKELTLCERERIIDRLSEHDLNSYLIGSKEDPCHRVHWKAMPPQGYFDGLAHLIKYGRERGVVVIPAVAPGLDYNFSSLEDEMLLIERFKRFIACGAEKIALCMDDLPLALPDSAADLNLSLGEFHGNILSRISSFVSSERILFCPTVYTNELFGTGPEADSYLSGLKRTMPESINIFWTGKNTIAESIEYETCKTVIDLFGERVLFWDNYYANDYATTRLFVGPFENRDYTFIAEKTGGIMINPTGMIETDLMIIDLFGVWKTDKSSSESQWQKAASRAGVPSVFLTYLNWFRSPFVFPSLEQLSVSDVEPMHFFDEFLVSWQGNLKREWYPYLHRFFTELKLFTGKVGSELWFDQRFYPLTAQKLKSVTSKGNYSVL